jgi:carboxyl-terminal processing protease
VHRKVGDRDDRGGKTIGGGDNRRLDSKPPAINVVRRLKDIGTSRMQRLIPPIKRLTRRTTAIWLSLMLMGVASGCTSADVAYDSIQFDAAKAEEVLSAGFTFIQDVYIDKPDIAELALTGLNGLRRIEPALAIVRSVEGEHISLLVNGKAEAHTKLDTNADAAAWAQTTTRLIEASRNSSRRLKNASAEEIYAAVFENMVRQLDAYTRYSTAEAAREERAQRDGFGGIGASIEAHADGALIRAVKAGQPADTAGLKVGDRILAIAGEPITGLPHRRVIALLRGPVETEVQLTIRRDARAEPFTVSITRAYIIEQTVFLRVHGDFALIRLTGFNQDTLREMREAAEKARQKIEPEPRGIIIDLRGNPGGLLDQAVEIADLFLKRGAILRTKGRHPRSMQYFDADNDAVDIKTPIAILLDGASASAAEIVASALQDQGRAIVVGASSFGKGTVQQVRKLPNDGQLVLTWARMHAPSGYVLHRLGVLPTICTSRISDSAAAVEAFATTDGAIIRRDFRARRNANQATEDKLVTLKKLCPWQPHEGEDLDLEIAEAVLKQRVLYEKLLAFARPPLGS